MAQPEIKTVASQAQPRIRFDRNEFSGAFGDIGTDFPLIVGMILAAKLDPAGVLILFGAMQVLTGLRYGIPMPAQPLKAMAAIVITQKLSGNILYGGGLAIGLVMLFLAATGLIDAVARAVPKPVVRGIQFGLGLQLARLALEQYLPTEGVIGYALGALAFVMIVWLLGNRRFPPAPLVILLGITYALFYRIDARALLGGVGVALPRLHVPARQDIFAGLVLLALPQIPLSIANSILATRQIANDLFPERRISVRTISFTYAAMNLINPFFGGIPTCHGSGGMAGHYAFGGRTGGSVVIYGFLYLLLGFFFSGSFEQVIHFFPKPVLGMILFFEALTLLVLIRDITESRADLSVTLLVGLAAVSLPFGYVIGLVLGTVLAWLVKRRLTGLVEGEPGDRGTGD
ncbi:MAG TPA: putative sulfate/molybdate transporter [Acidobacteriota bacterium]|jgi:MFS superfamily sulfate permease-like transporter